MYLCKSDRKAKFPFGEMDGLLEEVPAHSPRMESSPKSKQIYLYCYTVCYACYTYQTKTKKKPLPRINENIKTLDI